MTQQRPSRQQRRAQARQERVGSNRIPLPDSIEVEYVKSNDCRTIFTDGVYGGLTGRGTIYMALYVQHNKVPQSAQLKVDKVLRRITPEGGTPFGGWTRSIEAEVILPVDFAKSLRDWLDDKIRAAENAEKSETLEIRELHSSIDDTT